MKVSKRTSVVSAKARRARLTQKEADFKLRKYERFDADGGFDEKRPLRDVKRKPAIATESSDIIK